MLKRLVVGGAKPFLLRSAMRTMSYEIQYQGRNISLIPPLHKHTLIWLHGLGGTALEWIDLFRSTEEIKLVSPETTKVVLLSAPIKEISIYRDLPATSWYNVCHIGGAYMDCEKDVDESCELIEQQIRDESKYLNSEYSNIIIGGFSQGCAMALAVALKFPKILGGVCGFSGVLLQFVEVDESKKEMPIFLYHGESDHVIPSKIALKSYRRLQDKGFNVTLMTEDGLNHSISYRGLENAQHFISSIFSSS